MKKFILNNKIKVLVTIFFTFLLLILNNNVFALTFTYNETEYNIDLPSDFDVEAHPDFVIIKGSQNVSRQYQLAYPASEYDLPFIRSTSGDPSGIQYYKAGTTTNGQWKYYNFSDNSWGSVRTTSQYTASLEANNRSEGTLIYSSSDVYFTDGTLFFQKTPLVETPEIPEIPEVPETPEEIPQEMGTLQEIMEHLEKEAVLKEIVALLPVILSVLVSLIALRKALRMLSNFLKAS